MGGREIKTENVAKAEYFIYIQVKTIFVPPVIQTRGPAILFALGNRHSTSQMRFHGEQASALTSTIQQCRRQLHVTAILVDTFSVVYFSLVAATSCGCRCTC